MTFPIVFANEMERLFAKILDYYGIVWQYEPKTFPLEWDNEGNISEAFTPDFYLPQQDLFIEITTLRSHLTNKKNRRIRKLKERYPDINIKLFKRADLRHMMVKYGLEQEAGNIAGDDTQ
jgi:hypothetical protein